MAHKKTELSTAILRLFILGLILALPVLILSGNNASSASASPLKSIVTGDLNRATGIAAAIRVSGNVGKAETHKDTPPVAAPLLTDTPTSTPTRTSTPSPTATLCGVNSNYAIATGTATIVAGTFDIGNHSDEDVTHLNLPFSFRLYDQTYTGVTVSPNGTAEFASELGAFTNDCLPAFRIPTYAIYVLWDDQTTFPAGKGIYTSVTGVAPNRIYNIEWRTDYVEGGEANYELRLYETSATGRFDILYGFVGNGNANSTAGVQKNNTLYTQYFCNNTGGLPTMGKLLTFTQPACGSVTPSATPSNTATNTAVVLTNTPTRTNTATLTTVPTHTGTPTITSTRTNTPVGPTFTSTSTNTNTAVPTSTRTSTNTSVPTNTSTNSPVPTNTNTSTSTSIPTSTSTPTRTNTPLPTQTQGGFTATPVPTNTITPTNTPVPTNTNTATNTLVPTGTSVPTNTSTNTPLPQTGTSTRTNTAVAGTPTRTSTPVATNTSGPGITPSPSATSTPTSTVGASTPTSVAATPTSTVCPLQFTDVPADHTFYANIRCLACRGIINGYTTGCDTGNPCFKPGTNVTRGQLAKIVSNSAGFTDPPGAQQFEDLAPSSTFFEFVYRLASRGYIAGYPCGGPGEPCGSGSLPYFRPNALITRGQITKIVSNAAGFVEPAGAQQFQDVAPASTFYDFVWRLANRSIMSGYQCGGAGEPCVGPSNFPYFRPAANATRGQASKIVANTFFPACQTPFK